MIKKVDDELYNELVVWWSKRKFTALPRPMLPDSGYVSIIKGHPVVAGFLYLPQSGGIGWFIWGVSNPDASKEDRDVGWNEVTEQVDRVAKANGIGVLFSSSVEPAYVKRMLKQGYTIYEEGSANMLKILGGS